jgi:alginate O-acetyltransferase complex protein AlgI
MLFNSYEFIFAFLPIVLVLYYLLPARPRVWLLTLSSYFFYGWWDFRFCSLMLISTMIDYYAGVKISTAITPKARKSWMVLSIISNLSLLGFFKYFDLAAGAVNYGLSALFPFVDSRLPLLHLILPVGISFYTFQSMSYSIDIYQRAAKPARSFIDFACYVALFPQLIAGPIVRYRSLADQLVERVHSLDKFALGCALFVCGLAKKMLLADAVALLTPLAYGRPDAPDLLHSWLGALGYTMQIYFDFSGYSDMAVGLGLMFGFSFPINFYSPYKAVSITDFWRRWHISLSTWLRDYLYIPLGGNRLGPVRTYANLIATMLLGGLWHGANWTFLVWGGFHGVLLALERYFKIGEVSAWRPVRQGITFILVVIGWVFFRAANMHEAGRVLAGMVGLNGMGGFAELAAKAGPAPLVGLILAMALAFGSPNTWQLQWRFSKRQIAALLILFLLSIGAILVNTSSPFLYFQF